jgi:hypothetical protein
MLANLSEHAADCPNLSFEEIVKLHNSLKDDLLDSAALVAVGFRFADPYIHETIDFALRANRELRVICCLKHDPQPNARLWKLMQAFPERVVLLRGIEGKPVSFGKEGFLPALEEILRKSRIAPRKCRKLRGHTGSTSLKGRE